MKKVNQLSEADHQLVTKAVGEAEKHTDGEIVTIITDLSDKYYDAGLQWAIGITFLFLSSLAIFPAFYQSIVVGLFGGWEQDFTTAGEQMAVLFIASVTLFLAMSFLFTWTPLRLWVTPKSTKQRRVRKRAIDFFKVGAERRTMGLTGILIYVSLKEHRAEIVADQAIAEKVSPEIWGEAMVALIDEVRAGRPGEGMAAAVRHVGKVLAEHFPKTDQNPNELPDRLIEL
ncbi:hypothetical protein AB1K62_01510 [Parasphingorhabdus sp. JC815]|uniref:TPM domain-containing protein n=1 Tax=Parasphingorhabdus sp. JC815 TaxID=3232140 RepID=UPI003459C1CB